MAVSNTEYMCACSKFSRDLFCVHREGEIRQTHKQNNLQKIEAVRFSMSQFCS